VEKLREEINEARAHLEELKALLKSMYTYTAHIALFSLSVHMLCVLRSLNFSPFIHLPQPVLLSPPCSTCSSVSSMPYASLTSTEAEELQNHAEEEEKVAATEEQKEADEQQEVGGAHRDKTERERERGRKAKADQLTSVYIVVTEGRYVKG